MLAVTHKLTEQNLTRAEHTANKTLPSCLLPYLSNTELARASRPDIIFALPKRAFLAKGANLQPVAGLRPFCRWLHQKENYLGSEALLTSIIERRIKVLYTFNTKHMHNT